MDRKFEPNERHDLIELEVRASLLLLMVMIVMMATSTWEIETRSAGSGVPTSKVSSGKLSWYWNIVHEIKCKYQKIKLNKKKKHQLRIEVGLLPESKRDGMRTPQCRKDASAGPAISSLYYYHIMLLLSIVVTMLFGSNVFRVTSFV